MGEIAFVLGFEEVNSFVRAFHAWEGTAPAKWRARAGVRRDESRESKRSVAPPAPPRGGAGGRRARGA
jgi:AraC-like DNA-binding protein